MRLLILGASGGCGRWLTRMAAERGHHVTALVRRDAAVEPLLAGVTVQHDDVLAPDTLDDAVGGHDAVLSCLGQRRAGKHPWAALRSPPDLVTRVTQLLIPAMARHGVTRVVAVSAGGVGASRERLSWPVQRMVDAGNVGVAYRDLAGMERLLAESALDWYAVRPVTLVEGGPTGRAAAVERYGLFSTVRRADVAQWMLDVVEREGTLAERHVLLGTGPRPPGDSLH